MADEMLVAAGAGTAWHSREVQRIALRMADRLGLNGGEREAVGVAARLHDIGKVAIPRAVLEKPGPLTAAEWELIRRHTVIGERILSSVEELRWVAALVRHSHERWDGSGYPDRLRREQIPLGSRIIFCADAFQAISTDRPYQRGKGPAAALAQVRRSAGTQFEPRVVDALAEVVRDELYGARTRVRRRSHRRLTMLLVCALSLGGSIAVGIAASRDSSRVPERGSESPQVRAPAGPAELERRAEAEAAARGAMSGALAKGGDALAALEVAETQEPPPAPQSPSGSPAQPARPPEQGVVTRPSPAIPPVSGPAPVSDIGQAVGSRLGSVPSPSEVAEQVFAAPPGGDAESKPGGPAPERANDGALGPVLR